MAKDLRPKGKVAGKEGLNPQYKLREASEEFHIPMTSQNDLLANHSGYIARTDRDPVQHCAVDDASNTVRLTGLLIEEFAAVDVLSSLEEASAPETVWPPEGPNTRILSIDTYVTALSLSTNTDWYVYRESCCLPEHANSPRGQKHPSLLSELGIAFIDTDTIRAYPLDWQERITTSHAIITEHWNYHPNRRAQDNMGIDDREPFYPRFNASSGPSGSLQEQKTFIEDGESYTVTMSPDSEIISQDRCLEWLLAKVQQEAPVDCLPLSSELARTDSAQGTIHHQEK
jgi:hypothetical protein